MISWFIGALYFLTSEFMSPLYLNLSRVFNVSKLINMSSFSSSRYPMQSVFYFFLKTCVTPIIILLLQLKPDYNTLFRDGSARITYELITDCSQRTVASNSPAVVSVNRGGQLSTSSVSGTGVVLVTIHEEFGINQTAVVHVEVHQPLLFPEPVALVVSIMVTIGMVTRNIALWNLSQPWLVWQNFELSFVFI